MQCLEGNDNVDIACEHTRKGRHVHTLYIVQYVEHSCCINTLYLDYNVCTVLTDGSPDRQSYQFNGKSSQEVESKVCSVYTKVRSMH